MKGVSSARGGSRGEKQFSFNNDYIYLYIYIKW